MREHVRVRVARASDVAAIAAIPAGHPHLLRYGLEPAATARAVAEATARGDEVWVAEADGRVTAFGWWLRTGAFGRSPYLRVLAVEAGATGTGIGGLLLEAVEVAAFADAHDLFLLVTADNDSALRFYERRGYARIGTLHDYVLPGVDEVLMRKRR